jgi:hypothetical protein
LYLIGSRRFALKRTLNRFTHLIQRINGDIMPLVITGDTYRTPHRMAAEKAKKNAPKPVSSIGGGREGTLISFLAGQGGPPSP